MSKTREKRARNTIARQKTVGKTPEHLTASQHPGVSAPRHHICNQPSTHQPRWKREEASRGRKENNKKNRTQIVDLNKFRSQLIESAVSHMREQATGRTRQRSQKSINRHNRNDREPNPGHTANNRQPSPTCRHPHTHQSIPHYGRNRIGRDTGTTASFALGRPS